MKKACCELVTLAPEKPVEVSVARAKRTRWLLRAPAPVSALAAFAHQLGLPPRLAAILYARGVHSVDALEPPFARSPNPALEVAAERIIAAMNAKKRIRIHGDYDADGITGASVLMLGLRDLGANVHAFIPHRLTDGYGVHPDRVLEHVEACDLFITVDCGVSNLEEIEKIVEAGVEAIVTDHHAPGKDLPGCLVVHPALAPNYHHDLPALTGSGVAFHLLWAVHEKLGLPAPLEFADLAAIGTIADCAPLLGENRALVKVGLEMMKSSRWPGIRAVVDGQIRRAPTARDVAFVLAPRINAAGRLGEAEVALELLTTDNQARAAALATYLDARNHDRKAIQDTMLREALEIVDPEAPAIVVTKADWHPGVMGIVASKLVEKHFKPVFIIAEGKGSVRSTPGISAVGGLRHAHATLKRYGGHSQAAGFAILEENISAFRDSIFEFTRQHPEPLETVLADAIIEPGDVNFDFLRSLEALEPFGEGNPAPVFLARGPLEDAGPLGKTGRHFQYRLAGIKGKIWDHAGGFERGDKIDAAVQLEQNEFKGRVSLEYTSRALRYAAPLRLPDEDLDAGPQYPRVNTKPELERLNLEPAPVFALGASLEYVRKTYPNIPIHISSDFVPVLTLLALPEPELIAAWIAAGVQLRFALTDKTLTDLETRPFWTLEKLRDANARKRRGETVPARALELLREIPDLERADVYRSSFDLIHEEVEAYRLRSFCQQFRHSDEASFSSAVRKLFGSNLNG